jgi:hypothetical protein
MYKVQLLHAVGVPPYPGPVRYLARLARCDPSRLGLDASRTKKWLLARDEWEIICLLCIRASINAGTPAYERALWRLATCTFCPRHRTPLIRINSLSQVVSDIDHYESKVLALTDLEQFVSAQLFEFEREIARAFHGIAPPHFGETLTASKFLHVLNDLITFAVDQWEVDITHGVASSLDQHVLLLKHHCSQLFDCRRPRRLSYRRSNQEWTSLSQIADPATRRAALWLVMQVIRLPPTPRPTHALHATRPRMISSATNRTPAGRGWLPKRKPGRDRTACTSGRAFRATMTDLKGQMTSIKVQNDTFKGCRQRSSRTNHSGIGGESSVLERSGKGEGERRASQAGTTAKNLPVLSFATARAWSERYCGCIAPP